MTTTTRLLGLGLAAAAIAALPVPSAQASPRLDWKLCTEVANGWTPKEDRRSECAQLEVPMDYAQPQGRKIKIAVSRVKATDPARRKGSIFFSGGGPGLGNIYDPISFAERKIGELNTEYDFLGMDPRGTSYSDRLDCDRAERPPLPPTATARERAKDRFDAEAEYNKACAAKDPDFVRQLTPSNAARDVDAIRAAVGDAKIGFYGVSYGTLIGTRYRSLFDGRVDKMLLDSGMPAVQDHPWMDESYDRLREPKFPDFLNWLAKHDQEYHFGTTPEAVRKTLFDLREDLTRNPRLVGAQLLDREWATALFSTKPQFYAPSATELAKVLEGGAPTPSAAAEPRRTFGFERPYGGLNPIQYSGMFCNEGTGNRDFEQIWAANEERVRRYPATGGGNLTMWCAGWPTSGQALKPVRGNSPLQHVGHLEEDNTPYSWTRASREAVGGALLTVLDGSHGSFARIPCGAKALDFFRTGRTASGSCPGVS